MKPGRNDPCPCGSGRKYKHCCLAAATQASESPQEITWRRLRRATEGFPKTMARFVEELYGLDAIDEAWEEFTLWEEVEFDSASPHVPLFLPWFYHCWAPDPLEETCVEDTSLHGRAPTSVFLEQRGARLDPLHRRYLQACLEAPFSFHEILRCDPGHGFRARDLIIGTECEVLERSASQSLEIGDILFAQIVSIEGIFLVEACPMVPLPPMDKIEIIDLRKRTAPAPTTELFAQELLRGWEIELRELYHELVTEILEPPPVEIHNTDGEFVVPQRVTFDIDSPQAAFDALKHLALGESEDELLATAERRADGELARIELAWKKAGNRVHASWDNTILGHVEIAGERLVVDVNSNERAEAFRKIVEDALGGSARYRGSENVTTTESTDEEDAAEDEEQARLAELPEVRENINAMLAAHYEGWVTQEIPALGNRRPLDAVKDPDGREKVEALLSQMERDARRMHASVDDGILNRLREHLGLSEGRNQADPRRT